MMSISGQHTDIGESVCTYNSLFRQDFARYKYFYHYHYLSQDRWNCWIHTHLHAVKMHFPSALCHAILKQQEKTKSILTWLSLVLMTRKKTKSIYTRLSAIACTDEQRFINYEITWGWGKPAQTDTRAAQVWGLRVKWMVELAHLFFIIQLNMTANGQTDIPTHTHAHTHKHTHTQTYTHNRLIQMHACTHTHMHKNTNKNACTRMHAHTHTHTHTHTVHTHMHTHTHRFCKNVSKNKPKSIKNTNKNACTCTCVHAHTHTHMDRHKCMHANTNMHKNSNKNTCMCVRAHTHTHTHVCTLYTRRDSVRR